MAVPTAEITRLSTGQPSGYNNGDYNASTNPYGFGEGGHRTNLYALTRDVTVVTEWLIAEVDPLLDISTELEALGAIVADLTALSAIITDVSAVADIAAQITTVAGIAANVSTVATNAANVTAVANDIAKVAAVQSALTNINAVAAALSNIATVVAMAVDIATVAARATDIATLADIEDGTEATNAIQTVAGIATAVGNVSANSAAVVAVAGDLSDINTVAGISTSVTALGAVADDIGTVAGISSDVETVADNIADVIAAPAAAEAARKSVRHIIFDSGTADAHPGAGHFRLSFDINAATVGATGYIYQDLNDADGGTQSGFIDSWDDVINATGRGNVSLVGEADPSISALLRITGAVSNGTLYKKAPITLLNKSLVGGNFTDEMEFTQTFSANGNDAGGGAGSGDVTTTGTVTTGRIARYADGTGDVIEDAGKSVSDLFDKTADDLDDIADGTTYKKYTATEKTKLAGIEALADVTDAANVGGVIHAATGKSVPVDNDEFALIDSAASNVIKKTLWSEIKATLKTYLDTLYSAIGHTHTFASLTSKPTTLSGYGIGDAQGLDTDLTAIAALVSAANKIPYATGAGTWSLADFPASARTAFTAGFSTDVLALLDDATLAAMRTTLGVAGLQLARNGSFAVAQRSMPTADNSYSLDGWRLLVENANGAVITQDTSDVPTGAGYACKLVVGSGNNGKFGIFSPIENKDMLQLRGGVCSLRVPLKATAGLTNSTGKIRIGIAQFTGTADAVSGDPISTWGAEGTNPTLATNWTFANTPAALSVTTSWADYLVENVSISASATNIAILIWSDDRSTTTSTDILRIGGYVTLTQGAAASPPIVLPYAEELRRCQRYYEPAGLGGFGRWSSASIVVVQCTCLVEKRTATPNLALLTTSPVVAEIGVANRTGSSSTIISSTPSNRSAYVAIDGFSAATTGNQAAVNAANIVSVEADL